MVNYQLGKIYKFVCKSTGLVYYGSTCKKSLSKRLAGHKSDYIRGKKCASVKILENNNYGIFLVENYPCNNKDELRMRERFYIENNECVNECIPIITKEERPLYLKEYKERNKTKINENKKIYNTIHKHGLMRE